VLITFAIKHPNNFLQFLQYSVPLITSVKSFITESPDQKRFISFEKFLEKKIEKVWPKMYKTSYDNLAIIILAEVRLATKG
jgi:hypothetical protein